jgi:hypothetical protein
MHRSTVNQRTHWAGRPVLPILAIAIVAAAAAIGVVAWQVSEGSPTTPSENEVAVQDGAMDTFRKQTLERAFEQKMQRWDEEDAQLNR